VEEIGIVKEIIGTKAMVIVERQGGCESCPGGSVCKNMGGGESAIEAVNQANARLGDTVRIVFKPYTYIKGAVFVYGIPALMLIIGAVIGKEYISKIFPGMEPDLVSAVSGFGFFIFSFLVMKFILKRYEGKKEYMPVIEEIVMRNEQ
jgi:sigma-E factor negative regulatory protein RseC